MRFETEPGYQAQVDFGEFQFEGADGTIGRVYLFSMILGFSRSLYSEFVDRCDLPTFLGCHIRAFDHFGGVTEEILYDRMKNVFVRKLTGSTTPWRGLPCITGSSRGLPLLMPPG
jgi:transposase